MMLFAHADRSREPEGRLSHARPMRCALVIAALALSLSALAGILSPTRDASAAPAPASSATAAGARSCLPTPGDGQPIPATRLVQVLRAGSGLSTLGTQGECTPLASIPQPTTGVPTGQGQVILVSRRQQWLWAYQNGQLVFATPITTGQPDLPTPLGAFRIMRKESNTTFYSPWPKGSPYYYAPLHIDDALLFRAGGFYIHDAPWRQVFGPGSNLEHPLADGTTETGSHGCVDVPVSAGAWLYAWAHVGTQFVIVDDSQMRQATPAEHTVAPLP